MLYLLSANVKLKRIKAKAKQIFLIYPRITKPYKDKRKEAKIWNNRHPELIQQKISQNKNRIQI